MDFYRVGDRNGEERRGEERNYIKRVNRKRHSGGISWVNNGFWQYFPYSLSIIDLNFMLMRNSDSEMEMGHI